MSGPVVTVRPLLARRRSAEPWDLARPGPPPFAVAHVEGDDDRVRAARAELPGATEEALLVLLRRCGASLDVGVPEYVSRRELRRRLHAWGRASVDVVRGRPDLLPELRIGAWAARHRMADAAFWRGVRGAATASEWRRLTGAYSVLVYHRLAGEERPGQERIDMAPADFARQVRVLRRAGFRLLAEEELERFHRFGEPLPARRAAVITVDDATVDAVEALRAEGVVPAQVFAVTGAVGTRVAWLDGVPLASWDDLRRLAAAGVAVGAHTRTHPEDLCALDDADLASEVDGSRRDLAETLGEPRSFAYPHGRHDERVRQHVVDAGFALAYTTAPGLNGAGADPYALRRVSPKSWDSALSLLWKARTGRPVPVAWERWLVRRHALARRWRSRAE